MLWVVSGVVEIVPSKTHGYGKVNMEEIIKTTNLKGQKFLGKISLAQDVGWTWPPGRRERTA